MKLWLISQTRNNGYDTYDSAVVAAESETEARHTHPSSYKDPWNDNYSWSDPADVTVRYLGEATEGILAGSICASFNAG